MFDVITGLICIFYKLGYFWNEERYLNKVNSFLSSHTGYLFTVFSRLNAPSVYLKFGLRDPAFNRGPAFINEVKF